MKNLHATVLHQMGLDPNGLTYFYGGLDQKLVGVEGAEPIKQIIYRRGSFLLGSPLAVWVYLRTPTPKPLNTRLPSTATLSTPAGAWAVYVVVIGGRRTFNMDPSHEARRERRRDLRTCPTCFMTQNSANSGG